MTQHGHDFLISAMNPDGSSLGAVEGPLPSLTDPVWSPDGTTIAFSGGERANTEAVDIYMAKPDGTSLTRLTFDPEIPDWQPAWSPDGTKIALVRHEDGHSSLFILDLKTREIARLTANEFGGDQDPAWSPDGTTIAFSRNSDGIPSIYLVRADGSGLSRLTDPRPGADIAPVWSPDGTRIAFTRTIDQDEAERDIYVMNVDGSDIQRLTDHPAMDVAPTWSPDGSRLAFLSNRDHPNQLLAELPEDELPLMGRYDVRALEVYLMAPDGTGERRLTFDAHAGYSPLGWKLSWGSA